MDDNSKSLIEQAKAGNYEQVSKIISKGGANLDIKDNIGLTALHYSIGRGYTQVARLLIDSGANIELKDSFGANALMHAAHHNNYDITEKLLEKNAKINEINIGGYTALMFSTGFAKGFQTDGGSESIAFKLIASGADVNIQSVDGSTALMLGVQGENLKIVGKLLEKGADLYLEDIQGNTALDYAKNDSTKEVIRKSIQKHIFKDYPLYIRRTMKNMTIEQLEGLKELNKEYKKPMTPDDIQLEIKKVDTSTFDGKAKVSWLNNILKGFELELTRNVSNSNNILEKTQTKSQELKRVI